MKSDPPPTNPVKYHVLALVSYLLMPVFLVAGGAAFALINPEIAAGLPNYERNFRLLHWARSLTMVAAFVACGLTGLGVYGFALKARRRSLGWLPLALLGPFGLAVLTVLGDAPEASAPAPKRKTLLRLAGEAAFLVVLWYGSYFAMVARRELMIFIESLRTGTSIEQIKAVQAASSGMWAFSEGLFILYLIGAVYLARPLVMKLAAALRSEGS